MSFARLARLVADLETELARTESILALGASGMCRAQIDRLRRRCAELEDKRDIARSKLTAAEAADKRKTA